MKIRLKDFRQAQGLYQADLARIIGCKQYTISRMELRESTELTSSQLQKLTDRFGEEEVNKFMGDGHATFINSNNVNKGNGTQNNGTSGASTSAIDIIRKQNDVIERLINKQTEITDRLLSLVQKMEERL